MEDRRKVEAARLVMLDGQRLIQLIGPAIISLTVRNPSWAISSRTFLGDETHEVDHR